MNSLKWVLAYSSLTAIWLNSASPEDSVPPIRISRETTFLVSPIRDDGRVDYIAALNQQLQKDVTPENNSAVMFRRAIGHSDLSVETTDEYFRMLGIEVLPGDGPYLHDLDRFLDSLPEFASSEDRGDRYKQRQPVKKQRDTANSRPWTREEFPLLARWVDANKTPLQFGIEGSQRPKYFVPLMPARDSLVGSMSIASRGTREVSELLRVRAMLYLGEGCFDVAWQDVLAMHRIARLIAQGPGYLDTLIGIAIESSACRCDEQIVNHSGMDSQFARECLQDFRKLGLIDGLADRIDIGGRYEYLDSIQHVSRSDHEELERINFRFIFRGDKALADFVRTRLRFRAVDVDTMLIIGNSWFDRYTDATHKSTRTARTKEISQLDEERAVLLDDVKKLVLAGRNLTREESSRIVGGAFLNGIFPLVAMFFDSQDKCAMGTELSQCAFALAAWNADHGEYPNDLALLLPEYLTSIPIDRFNDKPLTYQRTETGYCLYSVGENLEDDGGMTIFDRVRIRGKEADDIAVRTLD